MTTTPTYRTLNPTDRPAAWAASAGLAASLSLHRPALLLDRMQFIQHELVQAARGGADEHRDRRQPVVAVAVEPDDGGLIEAVEGEHAVAGSIVDLDLGPGWLAQLLVVCAGGFDPPDHLVRGDSEPVGEHRHGRLVGSVRKEYAHAAAGPFGELMELPGVQVAPGLPVGDEDVQLPHVGEQGVPFQFVEVVGADAKQPGGTYVRAQVGGELVSWAGLSFGLGAHFL